MVAPMKHATKLPLLALALAACGPNYRYVYDGEAAFERCYALDYDDAATAPTRQQCWSAWLQSYSFGAGADRIDYARAHANGQAPQPVAPPAPRAMAPLPPAATVPAMEPFAPPAGPLTSTPAMTQEAASAWRREQISVGGNAVAAPPPTAAPAAPESEPPGASCATECHGTWHTCGTRCTGNDAACVARCDDGYRECMRGCF